MAAQGVSNVFWELDRLLLRSSDGCQGVLGVDRWLLRCSGCC